MSNLTLSLTVPASLNPNGVTIRTAGTADAPLFCLADVCRVLEIANVGNVADRLDADEKVNIHRADVGLAPGGHPIPFITESGLYAVILQSRKPQAKEFRKWVTADVLPAIRKTGCYGTPPVAKPVGLLLWSCVQVLEAMLPGSPARSGRRWPPWTASPSRSSTPATSTRGSG